MPPLLDSEDALAKALGDLSGPERDRVVAELAVVAERAARTSASVEQRRLAEALVLALARRVQATP